MSSTSAEDISTQAVSPVSILGASSAAATIDAMAVMPRKTRRKMKGTILLRLEPTAVSIVLPSLLRVCRVIPTYSNARAITPPSEGEQVLRH